MFYRELFELEKTSVNGRKDAELEKLEFEQEL